MFVLLKLKLKGGTAPAVATALSYPGLAYVGLYLTIVAAVSGGMLYYRSKNPNQAAKGYIGVG